MSRCTGIGLIVAPLAFALLLGGCERRPSWRQYLNDWCALSEVVADHEGVSRVRSTDISNLEPRVLFARIDFPDQQHASNFADELSKTYRALSSGGRASDVRFFDSEMGGWPGWFELGSIETAEDRLSRVTRDRERESRVWVLPAEEVAHAAIMPHEQ